MTGSAQILPVLIFLPVFLTALVLPVLGRWVGGRRLVPPLAVLALSASLAAAIQALSSVLIEGPIQYPMGGWSAPYGIAWRVDGLSAGLAALILTMALITLAASEARVRAETPRRVVPFYTLALLLISGLLGIAASGDLFNIFVFLEVASLSAYGLIATGGPRAQVAAFRYVTLGTIGASFYLLGIGFLYAKTGLLTISELAKHVPAMLDAPAIRVGVAFLIAGLGLKMAMFPLHGWLADAYSDATDTATALIAPIMTKTMVYILVRILFWVFGVEAVRAMFPLSQILLAAGAAGVVYGSVTAFRQNEFKRMLAYSSVSQIGFILLGLGVGNVQAMQGAFLHVLNHALMKGCLFLIASSAAHTHGVRTVSDLARLRGERPLLVAAFWIAALSMIGVPPTCGFFGKWYVLLGALRAGAAWVAVLIVASSLLTALYFFKALERTDFVKPARREESPKPAPAGLQFGMAALSAAILAAGWFSFPIARAIAAAMLPEGL